MLNSRISAWLHKANNRIHGTIKEKPSERLKCEQEYLISYGIENHSVDIDLGNVIVGLTIDDKLKCSINSHNSINSTINKRLLDLPYTVVQPTNLSNYDQLLGAGL